MNPSNLLAAVADAAGHPDQARVTRACIAAVGLLVALVPSWKPETEAIIAAVPLVVAVAWEIADAILHHAAATIVASTPRAPLSAAKTTTTKRAAK